MHRNVSPGFSLAGKWFIPIAAAIFLCINAVHVQAQYWMQKGGGTSADEAYSIAVDGSGNTYTTGYFTGTGTFGANTLTATGISDIFVSKTNSSGAYQWTVKAGDGGSDRGLAIACDGSGNSYVTGYYYGTATFGTYHITSLGLQDVFIAKYNSAGVVQWVVSAGGSQSDIGNAIAVDNSGNVIVTGQFTGTATFGTYTLTSTNNNINVFTTKINGSTGAFMWAASGVGPHTDRGLGVACDPSGNIYVTGQFSDTITFSNVHYSPFYNGIFIVKYNTSGAEQWFTKVGGGTSNIANAIAVDHSSNVFITGNFTGTLSFYANNGIFTLTQTYTNRIFVAKYDQSANLQWDVADGSSGNVSSNAIGVDGTGNAYITGDFECVMNSYADQYGQGTFNSIGDWDIFNAKYSGASGSWQWSRQIGGHGNNYGYGIAVSSSGTVYDAGSFDQDAIVPDAGSLAGYSVSQANGCPSSYCSDNNYGDYAFFNTTGNLDAFIASVVDLTRQPYDFYKRSGNGCSRPVVNVCVGLSDTCMDTVKFCSGGTIVAVPNACPFISPNFNYTWSTGAHSSSISVATSGRYSVTQTSADGCISTTGSIYVLIFPPPASPTISDNVVINTNSNTPRPIRVCEHAVILTGGNYAGDASWYWTTPTNTRVNGNTITVPVGADSGNYCFHVVDNHGCVNQTCVWVAIDSALPHIVPKLYCVSCRNDSAFLCKGQGFSMLPYDTITNPSKNPSKCIPYVSNHWNLVPWDSASYNIVTNCPDINDFIPHDWDSGWYNVIDTVIESNVCGSRKFIINEPIYVRIYPVPIINLSISGGNSLCAGDSEWIKGSGNVPFHWSNGSTKDSIYVGLGIYSISASATNSHGCFASATQSLNITAFVPAIPSIAMNPSDGIICPGDSVRMSCRNGPYQYFQWYGPLGPMRINDSVAYASIPGNYYCVGIDSTPCYISKLSNTVTLESYSTPYLQTPPITNICPGDSIILKVIASNDAVVQWQPPLSGDSIIQVIKTAGTYAVKITSCGITTTCSTTITTSSPIASITVTPSKTICTAGDSVKLTGLPHLANYLWQPGNDTNQFMYTKQAGTYSLNTVDTFGCSASADVVISPPVRDSITHKININCYGDSSGLITVGVKGGALPYTYSWRPASGSNATASNLTAGAYTVTVTDANGCTKTTPATLTEPSARLASSIGTYTNIACFGDFTGKINLRATGGQPPYTYLWSPGNYTSANLSGLGAGTYSVLVTDSNQCTTTSSVTLTQPAVLNVSVSEPYIICKDSTGILLANTTGGTAPYKYAWSGGIGSTSSTATITLTGNLSFSVTVTDSNGCTASAQIKLQYGPDFKTFITGRNTFCIQDSTTICATALNPTNGVTFLWEPPNNTNACITVDPASASVYTVTAIDGCGETSTATINLYPQPSPIVDMSADLTEGCAPFCVQFRDASTLIHGGINEYVWTFTRTGGDAPDSTVMEVEDPLYCFPASGTYNVRLTIISDSGCNASLVKRNMITVYSAPHAAFSFAPQPITLLTPTVQFTDNSTDAYGKIAYWWWNFGDGSDSSNRLHIPNPIHTYGDTGTYCPNLVVENMHGCTDTTTNCFVVEPIFTLYIPSAFSPNGDGDNEVFKPVGTYIKNFEMYIFDRWGMEIFHSTDINEGWNGTVHGGSAISQEDVYIYKIFVTDSEGNQHSYIGNVTLLK